VKDAHGREIFILNMLIARERERMKKLCISPAGPWPSPRKKKRKEQRKEKEKKLSKLASQNRKKCGRKKRRRTWKGKYRGCCKKQKLEDPAPRVYLRNQVSPDKRRNSGNSRCCRWKENWVDQPE